MNRQAVLLLALLCQSAEVIPQPVGMPVQIAATAQTPEPPPQPQPAPQKPPTTATPPGDTGMAGQVAEGSVVLPPAGALSTLGLVLGVAGILVAASLVTVSSDDTGAGATPTTGTR
jgi:hypothetical protein